ncbi:MAG: RagB/SusD family nutrient uptake outer membrane protein [Prevotellaceae bacterium]|jgi:hypothetical protein|nr:RagB/SusD family nutrient uptake outer membrane protein [Prevotellaceae bacterium]
MKKKIYIKVLLASFILGSFMLSCDVLDQPYHMGYDADAIFSDPEKIRSAAIGMYDAFQSAEFLGGRAQIYADIRGMDVNPASYFGAVSTHDGTLTSSNGIVQNAWTGAYRTLFEINLFLENIAANPGVTSAAEEQRFIAEAKFLRAAVYFYALNLWGQQYTKDGTNLGVPLVLRSFDGGNAFSDEAKTPRSTVDEVYNQIIKDLGEALGLPSKLDDAYENISRANANAVNAFLSRVYLYRKQYGEAIAAANAVSGYDLEANVATGVFAFPPPTDNKEIIFFVAMSSTDNPNTNNALGQHYGADYRGDITVSSNFLNLFEPDDTRLTLLKQKGSSYYCDKYANGSYNWAPFIRYAEVLLNKAEALAQQNSGVSAEAVTIINRIRTRSNASVKQTSDFTTKAELIEFILAERRRELAFEGHGSFDLFRNGKGIDAGRATALAAAIPYPSNLFALPIPQADITKAPGILEQNPGY